MASLKELRNVLTGKLDDMRDEYNELDKRLLEQTILKEQLERECEKYMSTTDDQR